MNTEMSSILLFYFIIYDFISPFAIVVPFSLLARFQDKSPPIQKVTRALKWLSSDSLTHSPCMHQHKTDQNNTVDECGRRKVVDCSSAKVGRWSFTFSFSECWRAEDAHIFISTTESWFFYYVLCARTPHCGGFSWLVWLAHNGIINAHKLLKKCHYFSLPLWSVLAVLLLFALSHCWTRFHSNLYTRHDGVEIFRVLDASLF